MNVSVKDRNGESLALRLKRKLEPQNKLKLRQKLRMAASFFPTDESGSNFKKSSLPYKYQMLLGTWRPYSAIEEDHDSSTENSFNHTAEDQKPDLIREVDHCLRLLFDDDMDSQPQKSRDWETPRKDSDGATLLTVPALGTSEYSPLRQSMQEKLNARNLKRQRLMPSGSKINLSVTSSSFEPEDQLLGKKKLKKLSFRSSEFRENFNNQTKSSLSLLGTLLSQRVSYQTSDPYRPSSFGTTVTFSAS